LRVVSTLGVPPGLRDNGSDQGVVNRLTSGRWFCEKPTACWSGALHRNKSCNHYKKNAVGISRAVEACGAEAGPLGASPPELIRSGQRRLPSEHCAEPFC